MEKYIWEVSKYLQPISHQYISFAQYTDLEHWEDTIHTGLFF